MDSIAAVAELAVAIFVSPVQKVLAACPRWSVRGPGSATGSSGHGVEMTVIRTECGAFRPDVRISGDPGAAASVAVPACLTSHASY